MADRVPLPEGLDVSDPDQALQQFLAQSTWDERAVLKRYRATMAAKFADPAGIFVIDASKLMGIGWRPGISTHDGIVRMMRVENGAAG